MPKNFHCSGCGGQHKRPVGVKCQFKDNVDSDPKVSGLNTDTNTDTINHDILIALNSGNTRPAKCNTEVRLCVYILCKTMYK